RANKVEMRDGVECFLWRTPMHPTNLRLAWTKPLERQLFASYGLRVPKVVREWARTSQTILVESGLPVAFFSRLRELNPDARFVYMASDDLETIGCADALVQTLEKVAPDFDLICAPSVALLRRFPPRCKRAFVPHGIAEDVFAHRDPSPYSDGEHAVCVGSMLFEAEVFNSAASHFPDITFHIIGGGNKAASVLRGANIVVHGEMPYYDTIKYIAHARFGIAPYAGASVAPYLAESSMKLMQFAAFGIPAICPNSVVGGRPGRFGYDPAEPSSIVSAIEAALRAPRLKPARFLSWEAVTERIVEPDRFADTRV
ncbi:MAG: 2-beta-glucuronyltransferase, partial [Variibacter sp.]|nr:2-beta-glucuronyltransferase [Variibacter sp.]